MIGCYELHVCIDFGCDATLIYPHSFPVTLAIDDLERIIELILGNESAGICPFVFVDIWRQVIVHLREVSKFSDCLYGVALFLVLAFALASVASQLFVGSRLHEVPVVGVEVAQLIIELRPGQGLRHRVVENAGVVQVWLADFVVLDAHVVQLQSLEKHY